MTIGGRKITDLAVEWEEEFSAHGVEWVKKQLALGQFQNHYQKSLAAKWVRDAEAFSSLEERLADRDVARSAADAARISAQEARLANTFADAANSIASRANELAVEANEKADLANLRAKNANKIAAIAAIMAIISTIAASYPLFKENQPAIPAHEAK